MKLRTNRDADNRLQEHQNRHLSACSACDVVPVRPRQDRVAHLERRQVQFSYMDDEFYVFMDAEDYSQYHLSPDMMAEQLPYITEGLEGVVGLLVNGEFVAIELPQSVVLEIAECAPGIKGASASARNKPATFASGLVIQVPEYLEVGERVRINTQEARYMSRA